ncbi:MAG: hypothetical protein MRY32_09815 [Rickettsiales bacterium]|nr:hypothetical protein [Rickettsiales bacterium]
MTEHEAKQVQLGRLLGDDKPTMDDFRGAMSGLGKLKEDLEAWKRMEPGDKKDEFKEGILDNYRKYGLPDPKDIPPEAGYDPRRVMERAFELFTNPPKPVEMPELSPEFLEGYRNGLKHTSDVHSNGSERFSYEEVLEQAKKAAKSAGVEGNADYIDDFMKGFGSAEQQLGDKDTRPGPDMDRSAPLM